MLGVRLSATAFSLHWLERLLGGSKSELGEALSLVERGGDSARELLGRIYPRTGRAQVVGVTGPPGSGKSALVNALALHFVEIGRRVGVIAIDPSSPFTGGAVLGDRIRMSGASGHERIFIRSAATRGALGGLARTTHEFVRVLDAVGYDPILVETVGIGQSEVDIWKVAHTPIVVDAPASGDAIQAMKAGVLEIAAILCLNKSDLPGSEARLSQLRELARSASEHTPGWPLPIVATVAPSGTGVAELAGHILAHTEWLKTTGRRAQMERERSATELRAVLEAELVDAPLAAARASGLLTEVLDAMAAKHLTAAQAAATIARQIGAPVDSREFVTSCAREVVE